MKLTKLIVLFILLCPLIFIIGNILYMETIIEKYNPEFDYVDFDYEMNLWFSIIDKFTHPIDVLTMLNYHINEVDGKLKISTTSVLINLYQLMYTLISIIALFTTGLLFGLLISNDKDLQLCCAIILPLLLIGVILINIFIEITFDIYMW